MGVGLSSITIHIVGDWDGSDTRSWPSWVARRPRLTVYSCRNPWISMDFLFDRNALKKPNRPTGTFNNSFLFEGMRFLLAKLPNADKILPKILTKTRNGSIKFTILPS